MEITQAEQQKEFKNLGKFKRPLRHIKCNNSHTIWVPEGEEREKEAENIFEDIRPDNFPNMVEGNTHSGAESTEFQTEAT